MTRLGGHARGIGCQAERGRIGQFLRSAERPWPLAKVSITRASWTDVYAGFQIAPADERANWKFVSQFAYEPFPPQAVEVVGSFMSNAPTPDCNYFTNAFGGAVRGFEPPGGSTFAHRDCPFYAEPGVGWGDRGGVPAADDPLTPACLSWLAEFSDALQPFVDGAYVNVPNPTMPDWATAYWGSNVDRLTAVKAAYTRRIALTTSKACRPARVTVEVAVESQTR